jgi:O-6-methylguanine DNA methyltransferase
MANYTKKYNPNRSAEWNYGGDKWKLSRSKIDSFIECPRCFYIDNKLGTKRPSTPAFTLNVAVDALFKKEFDEYRTNKKAHPLMERYAISAIPFAHEELDVWRDPFEGIQYLHEPTGLLVSGAVDDLWINDAGELIVVDYKATSKPGTITTLDDSSWADQYARQIGVYQWLLTKKGFAVSPTGYFVYANGLADKDAFNDTLHFETTVVPTSGDTSWIEPKLHEYRSVSKVIPFQSPANFANTVRTVKPAERNFKRFMQKASKSAFTERVREVVRKIPQGSVRTYKEVATKAGNPKAARAVAMIMSRNFDPKIPCHRVIRTDGGLGGYNRGGIEAKRKILIKEGVEI